MKKYIFPMLALAAGAAFTSCADQLDIEQKGVISTENYYQTEEDCKQALASAYEGFMINTVGRTTVPNGPGIYTPAKVLANHPGDDVNYGGGNYGDHEFGGSVDEFRYDHTPEAINFHYKGLYLSIYSDNTVINYFSGNDAAWAKQAVAEAKVLRAYNFFLLACYWGQPPFIDHLIAADETPSNSKMTQKEYFEWVAKECEDAVNDLSERKGLDDKEGAYRVTKGFAYALAGKAHLFAENYSAAKADLWEVIKSGKYKLVDGDQYLDLFHVEGDGCSEKIFEINMRYNPAAGDWSTGNGLGHLHHSTWMEANCFNWRAGNFVKNPAANYTNVDGWGSIGVPQWFGDEFHANDGDSKRFKATLIHIDDAVYQTSDIKGMKYPLQITEYVDEESKKSASECVAEVTTLAKDKWGDLAVYAKDSINKEKVIKDKEGNDVKVTAYLKVLDLADVPVDLLKQSKEVGISDLTQGLYGQSFWMPFKHLVRSSDVIDGGMHGGNERLNNIIVMRYAEVLLNYAEACLKVDGDASTDAKKYINEIQRRAGSKTVSDAVNMDVLKKEKAYELWFEGCRFQDVLRWNDAAAKARLAKKGTQVPHLFDKLYRDPDAAGYEGSSNVVWENGTKDNSRFYIVYTHEAQDAGFKVGFVEGKHNLFPYPSDVLSQNPSLHQNPGF